MIYLFTSLFIFEVFCSHITHWLKYLSYGREQAVSEERATQLRDKEQQHAADIREIEVNISTLKILLIFLCFSIELCFII